MCAITAAYDLEKAWNLANSQSNRGRDGFGFGARHKDGIDIVKIAGKITKFRFEDLINIFSDIRNIGEYTEIIGHNRYATSGSKAQLLEGSHPHSVGGKVIVSNSSCIVIKNCDAAIVHNGNVTPEYLHGLKTKCDTEALLHLYLQFGEKELLRNIPGSYALAIIDKKRPDMIVMRDRYGIKPCMLNIENGKTYIVSEESDPLQDLSPGAIYYLHSDGTFTVNQIVPSSSRHCFFEYNYLARLESVLDGVSVRKLREALGERLAQEYPPNKNDIITFIPRCPEVAARSYAAYSISQGINVEFAELLSKNDSERSFLGPTEEERKASITNNLHLTSDAPEIITGRDILAVEDSFVRGNNGPIAGNMLLRAGARSVTFISYTPPIGIIGEDGIQRGCMFGVDMPPTDNFIAVDRVRKVNRTSPEISDIIGFNVKYLSMGGTLEVFEKYGLSQTSLCTYCIGGKHPFS